MDEEMARVLRVIADDIEKGMSGGQVSDNNLWGFTFRNLRVEVELLSEGEPGPD